MMTNTNDKNSTVQNPKKRQHDNSFDEEIETKKQALAFTYDKGFHTFQRDDDHKSTYTHESTSGTYKVNVKKWNSYSINRIGFGKILHRMNVKNIDACKMISKNILCVHFSSREAANNFVANPQLGTFGYEATIPIYYRTAVGVIKNVPIDISAKELFDEINPNNAIVKIERMTRRMPNGHRNYALNIKIHFDGDTIPPNVTIYHGRERVQAFIPPVLQCTGCLRYGHHAKACKASSEVATCPRCGLKGHKRENCDKPQPTCIHCKQQHEATARICPERVRQNNIRIIMTGEKLSFKETIEKYPQYTSQNQFELLENLQEFPPLQRNTYKNTLLGKKQKLLTRPERSRAIFPRKQPEKYSSHYSQLAINTVATAAMSSNQHIVNEVEKEVTQASMEKKNEGNFAKVGLIEATALCQSTSSKNLIDVNSQQSEENLQKTDNTTSSSQ